MRETNLSSFTGSFSFFLPLDRLRRETPDREMTGCEVLIFSHRVRLYSYRDWASVARDTPEGGGGERRGFANCGPKGEPGWVWGDHKVMRRVNTGKRE